MRTEGQCGVAGGREGGCWGGPTSSAAPPWHPPDDKHGCRSHGIHEHPWEMNAQEMNRTRGERPGPPRCTMTKISSVIKS